jgi:D-arginine dehydrogenase
MAAARREVVIVGGGIAGASLAYFLAERGLTDVVLLEREPRPGVHATGRSAAVLLELDPQPTVQGLKVASAGFLRDPPSGFATQPLLTRSGILLLFREPLWSALRTAAPAVVADGVSLVLLDPEAAAARVPVLVPAELSGAAWLPEDGHIDVHALLSGYLREAARRGVEHRFGVEVRAVIVERGRCTGVVTDAGPLAARWVVDAAGAWAGPLARRAGAAPIDLVPLRRTIVTFAAPDGVEVAGWPLVASDPHQLYFAPESGGLLFSPMDEAPMAPCDPAPGELAVAEGLARLERLAPRLVPRTLRRRWAGLRTFAPDRAPVVGEDPLVRGFFWLAGQGGAGIETSPVVGQLAADLLVAGTTERFDARALGPARFAAA